MHICICVCVYIYKFEPQLYSRFQFLANAYPGRQQLIHKNEIYENQIQTTEMEMTKHQNKSTSNAEFCAWQKYLSRTKGSQHIFRRSTTRNLSLAYLL